MSEVLFGTTILMRGNSEVNLIPWKDCVASFEYRIQEFQRPKLLDDKLPNFDDRINWLFFVPVYKVLKGFFNF